ASVLLVDADLRQPSLHQAFGIPQDPGLSGILAGACAEPEAVARAETVPNLAVLPSGGPAGYPAEMLASKKMQDLIDRWRCEYDHVVIDTPPVSMFTDAVVLDGVDLHHQNDYYRSYGSCAGKKARGIAPMI